MVVVEGGDLLSVHYNGTFAHNDQGFDSSHARGQALTFQVRKLDYEFQW